MSDQHIHGPDRSGNLCDKRGESCHEVGQLCGTRHPDYGIDRLVPCGRIRGHSDAHRGWAPSMELIEWGDA